MSENLESVVSVDSNPQVESEDGQVEETVAENLEPDQESGEEVQDGSESEESEDTVDDEPSEELNSERLGSYLSAERKRLNGLHNQEIAHLQQEIEQLKMGGSLGVNGIQPGFNPAYNQAVNSGIVQDPLTGQYHDPESVQGQMVLREMQVQGMQKQKLVNEETVNKQRLAEGFQESLSKGHLKYENFSEHLHSVDILATPEIAEALVRSDVPAATINFLGKNQAELKKIAALPPHKQAKEIYKLEDRLTSKRKLTTSAPKPVSGVNSTRNTGAAVENQSIDQRVAANKERYFGDRTYG